MSSTGDLLRDLQAAHPALRAVVAAHRAEYDELLPHVLMADITRLLLADDPHPEVLAVLERHFSEGDADVQEVIALSFVENLLGEDSGIHAALGPRLARQLRRLEADWTPDIDAPPS